MKKIASVTKRVTKVLQPPHDVRKLTVAVVLNLMRFLAIIRQEVSSIEKTGELS